MKTKTPPRKPRNNPVISFEVNEELKNKIFNVAASYGLTISSFTRLILSKEINAHYLYK